MKWSTRERGPSFLGGSVKDGVQTVSCHSDTYGCQRGFVLLWPSPDLTAGKLRRSKCSVLNNFSPSWILSHCFWSPEQTRDYVLKMICKSSVQLKWGWITKLSVPQSTDIIEVTLSAVGAVWNAKGYTFLGRVHVVFRFFRWKLNYIYRGWHKSWNASWIYFWLP